MTKKIKVALLGDGIQGITSALLLQLAGFEVTVFSKNRSDLLAKTSPQQSHETSVSSYHAGASVIAHGDNTPFVKHLTQISLKIYRQFASTASFGIRPQRHFEIFEHEPNQRPNFLDVQHNVTHTDDLPRSVKIPYRPKAEDVSGWRFDAFFIEAIQYLDGLHNLFRIAGGSVRTQVFRSREGFEKLGDHFDLLVNCGNMGGAFMYEERANMQRIAGHYIKIPLQTLPYDRDGLANSYNYYPDAKLYQNIHGNALDLNFYPRWSWWYCGASRISEHLDDEGEWVSEGLPDNIDMIDLNGIAIPRPILDLNAEILNDFVGFDIRDETIPKFGCEGKRFRLVEGDGIRLTHITREQDDTPVILNYGHGGAGFTLSWGAALHILNMAGNITGTDIKIDRELKTPKNDLNLDYLFDVSLDADGEFTYALKIKLAEIYEMFVEDIEHFRKEKDGKFAPSENIAVMA